MYTKYFGISYQNKIFQSNNICIYLEKKDNFIMVSLIYKSINRITCLLYFKEKYIRIYELRRRKKTKQNFISQKIAAADAAFGFAIKI